MISCPKRGNRLVTRLSSALQRSAYSAILLLLCPTILLSSCDSAGANSSDASGQNGQPSDQPESTSADEALETIFFVYQLFNYYAIRTPEAEDRSSSFAGGTVTVTKRDSTDDIMNAYYEDTVAVAFNGYTDTAGRISGSGEVVAFIDSYNGAEGAEYTGSFTGIYQDATFTLTMDYRIESSTGAGITSAGAFTLNGTLYEIDADADMMYDFY